SGVGGVPERPGTERIRQSFFADDRLGSHRVCYKTGPSAWSGRGWTEKNWNYWLPTRVPWTNARGPASGRHGRTEIVDRESRSGNYQRTFSRWLLARGYGF